MEEIIKDKMKSIAELFKEAAENIPKDKWICKECNSENFTWSPDMEYLRRFKLIKYKHGICQTCRNIEDEKLKKYDIEIKERILKDKIKSLIGSSKIPPKILEANFDNLKVTKGAELAFKAMKRIDNADRWIYLHGMNSTGKTLLTGATINMLSKKLISSFYFNERAFFRRLKETYDNGKQESSRQIFQNLRNADFIFWDDFSTLRYSDWELGTSYDILELCETYQKKLILISNLDLETEIGKNLTNVEDRIGKRSIARIKRNNIFYVKMNNKAFA